MAISVTYPTTGKWVVTFITTNDKKESEMIKTRLRTMWHKEWSKQYDKWKYSNIEWKKTYRHSIKWEMIDKLSFEF